MQRVAQGAVAALDDQRGGHAGGSREADAAGGEQDRQHGERAERVEAAQRRLHQADLDQQRGGVERGVDQGEELGQLARADRGGGRALEQVVGHRRDRRRRRGQRDQPPGVGVVEREAGRVGQGAQLARALRRLAGGRARLAQPARRQRRRGEPGGRQQHQVVRADRAGQRAGRGAAGGGAQHAAQADRRVQALGLRDAERAAQQGPELQQRDCRDHAGPDVERVEPGGAQLRQERPEGERAGGGRGDPCAQRRARPQGARDPRVQLHRGQRGGGDGQVDQRQARGRDGGQKQRVARRLEHRVAADQPEQHQERDSDVAPLLGADGAHEPDHRASLPRGRAGHPADRDRAHGPHAACRPAAGAARTPRAQVARSRPCRPCRERRTRPIGRGRSPRPTTAPPRRAPRS